MWSVNEDKDEIQRSAHVRNDRSPRREDKSFFVVYIFISGKEQNKALKKINALTLSC